MADENLSETVGKVNGPTPQQLAAHERMIAAKIARQKQSSGKK